MPVKDLDLQIPNPEHIHDGNAWILKSPEDCDIILERIADYEAEANAIETRLAAITQRLGVLARDARRHADWLRTLYGPQLEAIARATLTGRKRTLHLTHGSISFRKTPGAWKILDQLQATGYLEATGRASLVRVERFAKIGDVRTAIEYDLEQGYLDECPGWIDATLPGE